MEVMSAKTWTCELGGMAHQVLRRVAIDSRQVEPGDCFFAIKGKMLDGHDFVETALENGAAIVVCSRSPESAVRSFHDRVFLRVADTTVALQELSRYLRAEWGGRVIGVTGSMGKTTTRTFTAQLLKGSFEVYESPASFNNQIGVPLSLFQVAQEHDIAVLELGMSHFGEIRRLADICRPDLAIITNVAPVHLEFFSNVDEIAQAKGEILAGMSQAGILVFNADDPRVVALASSFFGDRISFSLEHEADVQILDVRVVGPNRTEFSIRSKWGISICQVPFLGRHLLYNTAAAVAAAVAFGVDQDRIEQAIPFLSPLPMRGRIQEIRIPNSQQITLWDDSYNSNPRAVEMVLESVAQSVGHSRCILVLGEMLELGQESEFWHRKVGMMAAQVEPRLLVAVGPGTRPVLKGAAEVGFLGNRMLHFDTSEDAGEYLSQFLRNGDLLVVKGSRGVGLDRMIQLLEGAEVN